MALLMLDSSANLRLSLARLNILAGLIIKTIAMVKITRIAISIKSSMRVNPFFIDIDNYNTKKMVLL